MIEAIDVINFLSYITIGIMYILLIDLKYSMKNSLIAFSIFIVLSYGAFYGFKALDMLPIFMNTTFLAIPAAIFSIFLAKYKDSRFLFTLFSVDTFGLIVYIYARSISIPLGEYSIVIIIISAVLYAISLYYILKYRDVYINLQSQIKISWITLACFSIIAYVILTILISYPTPIMSRIHELPPIILVTLFMLFAYIIVYRVFTKEVEVYNERNEKIILELDNKYQKSRLELQAVYYKYAYEDEITGLRNRRAFEEMKTESKLKTPICLTMDINNLKEINDNNGHQEGDQALKILAESLKQTFNNQDHIYRIGGDEFVILLSNHDIDEIGETIKTLYRNLEECCKNQNCEVSVAIGYSSYQKDNIDSIEELFELADQRMYIDKAKYKLS